MATIPRETERLELHSGDCMSRDEFHHIYRQMPDDFQAELIGGVVYVASPLKRKHGTYHLLLGSLFSTYEARTPGVEAGDNATILLGDDSEPQPDLYLRILPEHGGRSQTTHDDYIAGPPELIAEIAHSSRAIDLHAKHDDYRRFGVCEYIVLSLHDQRFRWFDLQTGDELQPADDGILRIRTFPGLWIDQQALIDKDHNRLAQALEAGLNSSEHAEFANRLRLD